MSVVRETGQHSYDFIGKPDIIVGGTSSLEKDE